MSSRVLPFDFLALDHTLTTEQRDIRSMVREFVDSEIKPKISNWYESGELPARQLARQLGELGLLGMHLQGYECAGTDAMSYGLACIELEAGDSGLRSLVSVQGSLAMFAIHEFGSEEQKQTWLPQMARGELLGCFGLTEADFGSNPKGMLTSAKLVGNEWVINGSKLWITNGTVADVAVIWAQTEEGIRGFLVPTDTPGFAATHIDHKLSLRASETAGLSFTEMRVPLSAQLPKAIGLKAALQCLSEARFGIVFGAVGAARDALHTTLDYATTRIQFDRPIAGFQLTQQKLADATAALNTSYLLALRLGELKDTSGVLPQQISLGKLNNVRAALEIARTCRTILGGSGITTEYSVMRHMNNLESVLTYEGTHEIHTLVVGEAITGMPAYRN